MSFQSSVNNVLSSINTLQELSKHSPEAQAKIDAEKAEAERLKEQEFFDKYFKNNAEPYSINELTDTIVKELETNKKIYAKLDPEERKGLINNSIDNFFKNINEANNMEMSAMRSRAMGYAVKTGDLSNYNKLNAYYRSVDLPEQMSQQAAVTNLYHITDKMLPAQKDEIGESKAEQAQVAAQTKIAKQKNQMQNAKRLTTKQLYNAMSEEDKAAHTDLYKKIGALGTIDTPEKEGSLLSLKRQQAEIEKKYGGSKK